MKTLMLLALALTIGASADAAPKKKTKTVSEATSVEGKTKLGTDHSFNDANVHGRYQYADEGVITVENEKGLIDLLGMRRHFKDRLSVETNRN